MSQSHLEEGITMFDLMDYKGKYTIIQDKDLFNEDDPMDIAVGEISKENAIAEAPERLEACQYYGIPPYVGEDKELSEIYKLF